MSFWWVCMLSERLWQTALAHHCVNQPVWTFSPGHTRGLSGFRWRWGSPSKRLILPPNIDHRSCPCVNKNYVLVCRSSCVCVIANLGSGNPNSLNRGWFDLKTAFTYVPLHGALESYEKFRFQRFVAPYPKIIICNIWRIARQGKSFPDRGGLR